MMDWNSLRVSTIYDRPNARGPGQNAFPLCRCLTFVRSYPFTPDDHAMLGWEDGIDAIAVLDSFHLVSVLFSTSSELRGSEDDYDSLMFGFLGYIFACPCGPRFKAVFTLTQRLRDLNLNSMRQVLY
jgi:hypothetical protein